MGDQVTVTVANWDKYNIRKKDYVKAWWFSLSNAILEDVDIYDLSDSELRAWIYILSQASKKNCATVSLSIDHASRVCRVNPKALKTLIEKFSNKSILSASGLDLASTRQADGRHKQTNNTNKQICRAKPSDFDSVYRLFARKEGKKKGLEYLAEKYSIDDLPNLETASANYTTHVRRERKEKKFIKLFSTWVSEWDDWLDPEAGKVIYSRPTSEAPAHPPISEPNNGNGITPDIQNKLDLLKKGKAIEESA